MVHRSGHSVRPLPVLQLRSPHPLISLRLSDRGAVRGTQFRLWPWAVSACKPPMHGMMLGALHSRRAKMRFDAQKIGAQQLEPWWPSLPPQSLQYCAAATSSVQSVLVGACFRYVPHACARVSVAEWVV